MSFTKVKKKKNSVLSWFAFLNKIYYWLEKSLKIYLFFFWLYWKIWVVILVVVSHRVCRQHKPLGLFLAPVKSVFFIYSTCGMISWTWVPLLIYIYSEFFFLLENILLNHSVTLKHDNTLGILIYSSNIFQLYVLYKFDNHLSHLIERRLIGTIQEPSFFLAPLLSWQGYFQSSCS